MTRREALDEYEKRLKTLINMLAEHDKLVNYSLNEACHCGSESIGFLANSFKSLRDNLLMGNIAIKKEEELPIWDKIDEKENLEEKRNYETLSAKLEQVSANNKAEEQKPEQKPQGKKRKFFFFKK